MQAVMGQHIECEAIDIPSSALADALVADLRKHSHFSNVLTHVSDANWPRLEASFAALLDTAVDADHTPLCGNLLALACSGRGTSGRMLKPWLEAWLLRACGPSQAQATIDHLARLYGRATGVPLRRRKSAMRILREHDEHCMAAASPVVGRG